MAYFPHAFQKLLIATVDNGIFETPFIPTKAIPAARVGVVDPATNQTIDITSPPPALLQDLPAIYLAQGSLHTVDKLGPFHGGYKESLKTPLIDPKHVNRFYKHVGHGAQNQVVEVAMCDQDGLLECGRSYNLRVDIKGSPALRFLTHNLYNTFMAQTGCCPTDPSLPTTVKAWTVIEQWALGINTQVFFQPFVAVSLIYKWTDSGSAAHTQAVDLNSTIDTLTALEALRPATFTDTTNLHTSITLRLTAAYAETKFGNCSFDPREYYELEPLFIYTSVVDDSGNPCTGTGFCYTEFQPPRQSTGNGERIIREKLLSDSYMQEDWHQNTRLREVLDGNNIFNYIDRTKNDYTTYSILYSVPRRANPTGTANNDQYMITILVSQASANFEDWMNKYLAIAGNGVQMETV